MKTLHETIKALHLCFIRNNLICLVGHQEFFYPQSKDKFHAVSWGFKYEVASQCCRSFHNGTHFSGTLSYKFWTSTIDKENP